MAFTDGQIWGWRALLFKVAACTPEYIFKEKIYIFKGCLKNYEV